jgi:hypothetical protein
LEGSLGRNGVVWLTAVVIAAVFAWTFRLLIQHGTNVLLAVGLVLLAVSASMIHFLARPHVMSWLFTLAWFWILDSSERDCLEGQAGSSERRLWLLPLLMLAWVNVHGGFLVGIVLLGIFSLGALWNWFRARLGRIEELVQKFASVKRAQSLVFVGLLSLLASLVNPHGWKLYAHVQSYLSNRFLMDHIDEFQSPNFHGVAQKCFALLILIAMAALAVRGRKLRMSQGLTVLFAVYAGLYASRNIPVSAVLLVIIVGPLLWGTKTAELRSDEQPRGAAFTRFMARMTAIETGQRGHLWAAVALLTTLLIAMNGGRVGANLLMDAHFDPKRMPVAAVNYLEHSGVKGPVLSPDYWGGYLIYRLAPKTQVVVDDRHDLYGEAFFKSYLKMIRVEPGWEDFLRDHSSGCLLLPKDSPLAQVLIENHAWKPVYVDDLAIVFVRSSVNQ